MSKPLPYEEFKKKFRHLYNTWSALPENQKNLSYFVKNHSPDVVKEQDLCGSAACLCGVLPLAFPQEFEYSEYGMWMMIRPRGKKEDIWDNEENIYTLAGMDIDEGYNNFIEMVKLFGANPSQKEEHTDQKEVDRRMEMVENANSYEELIASISS